MHVRNNILRFVTIILLAAFAAGLYHIDTQSIWFDEGWSAYSAIQSSVQAAIDSDKTNPPLYYVIVNLAARGLGDSEFALRWISLVFGLLSVALGYQLGRQLFNARAGIVAALLLAVSPLLWWAGQEARMYTLLAVLVLLCALAWHKVVVERKRRLGWWVILCVAELALLYAHNTGPVVALWLNAVTMIAVASYKLQVGSRQSTVVSQQSVAKPLVFSLSTQHSVRSTILLWLMGQAAVGLLWLPYFMNQFLRLTEANSALNSTTPFTLETIGRLWQTMWTGAWAMVGQEPLLVGLSVLALVAALVLIPWRKANGRWLVLHVLVLTAGLWLALSVLGNEVHGRAAAVGSYRWRVGANEAVTSCPFRAVVCGYLYDRCSLHNHQPCLST